jgi:hypothetical protein
MKKMALFILLIFSVCVIYGDDTHIINEQKNKFINEGFGFKYADEEAENMELFLLNRGNPLNTSKNYVDNIWDTIKNEDFLFEYNTITVTFYKWLDRKTNKYKTLLTSIESKDGINYLFNIKHGMAINELEKIIGQVEFSGDNAFVVLQNQTSHGVIIYFYDDKIEKIIWRYSLQ